MDLPGDWFKIWFSSPYYHQLYFKGNTAESTVFIRHLVEYLQPATGSFIMDVACGNGDETTIFSAYDFDITGIDVSMDNILQARRLESDKLHFFQHDIRLPFWINYFNYSFTLFTRFGYFRTEREHYNAIRTLSNSLKTQGILVVDYLNVHYEEDNQVHKSEKEIEGVNFFLTKWYDETHFYKKIVVEDDLQQEPLVFHEKTAKFSLGDFNDMFAFHNLQIQEVFGDYSFNGYDVKKSPRLIMIAKKV